MTIILLLLFKLATKFKIRVRYCFGWFTFWFLLLVYLSFYFQILTSILMQFTIPQCFRPFVFYALPYYFFYSILIKNRVFSRHLLNLDSIQFFFYHCYFIITFVFNYIISNYLLYKIPTLNNLLL